MSWLLDVNLILASRWTTHARHLEAKAWIDSIGAFHTCAISELGFVRISLGGAFGANWQETQESWRDCTRVPDINFSRMMWTAAPRQKQVSKTPPMRTL
jgi:predicted nucleic acid-binding protein